MEYTKKELTNYLMESILLLAIGSLGWIGLIIGLLTHNEGLIGISCLFIIAWLLPLIIGAVAIGAYFDKIRDLNQKREINNE